MWSIVGSAGTVNLGDTGKVNFAGSAVQIGSGSQEVLGHPAEVEIARSVSEAAPVNAPLVARARVQPKTQAVIRYGVTSFGTGSALSLWELALTFRDGAGQVVATLIEVSTSGNLPGENPTVTETRLIRFDSQNYPEPSTNFRTRAERANPQLQDHPLDFDSNTYYVELALTAPELFLIGSGPGVAIVSLRPVNSVD